MTSATILTISSLIDSKIDETKEEVELWRARYKVESDQIYDEAEEKGWDDEKTENAVHELHSFNVWEANRKLLMQLHAAKDDFTSHDFH